MMRTRVARPPDQVECSCQTKVPPCPKPSNSHPHPRLLYPPPPLTRFPPTHTLQMCERHCISAEVTVPSQPNSRPPRRLCTRHSWPPKMPLCYPPWVLKRQSKVFHTVTFSRAFQKASFLKRASPFSEVLLNCNCTIVLSSDGRTTMQASFATLNDNANDNIMILFLERLSRWNILSCDEQVQIPKYKIHAYKSPTAAHVSRKPCSSIQLSC